MAQLFTHNPNAILRIGIPKGSLQDSTVDLFSRAGYHIAISDRSYFPAIDDPQMQAIMFRAQEMSRYVEDDVIDLGITGHDWVIENGSNVHEVCELTYSKATSNPVKWVLAVPEESKITSPNELSGAIISTELVNTTVAYFKRLEIPIRKVEFSWGATEVKARLVDAIVDVTETGSSLRANKLRVIDTLLTSTTRLICNHKAWADPVKRNKIEDLAMLLKGAIAARRKVGLKMNIPRSKMAQVLAILTAETSPTINELADPAWVAAEVVIDEKIERELVPRLSRLGATGIITYSLNKVVP